MAKVTITIEDVGDGEVKINGEFDPADGPLTVAKQLGHVAISAMQAAYTAAGGMVASRKTSPRTDGFRRGGKGGRRPS